MIADPTKFAEVTLSVEQLQVAIQACDEVTAGRASVDPQVAGIRRAFVLALEDCQRRAKKRVTNLTRSQRRTQAHENSNQAQEID